jgi:hypothetical protein
MNKTQKQIPDSIRLDAEKAYRASRNKDWSLHAHICRRYPFGCEARKQFNQVQQEIAAEYRSAKVA